MTASSGKPRSSPNPRITAQTRIGAIAAQISQWRRAPERSTGSAGRVGLNRDPVVGLAHPELVGGAGSERQGPRGLRRPFDGQLEVGDGAVDRVVLGAGGVGVDPADEV